MARSPYGGPYPYYRLSPNPATDFVQIERSDNNDKTDELSADYKVSAPAETNLLTIKEIQIVDHNGVVKYKKDCSNLGSSNTLIIPVNDLDNGIYTMRIFNGEKWRSEKIIVKH